MVRPPAAAAGGAAGGRAAAAGLSGCLLLWAPHAAGRCCEAHSPAAIEFTEHRHVLQTTHHVRKVKQPDDVGLLGYKSRTPSKKHLPDNQHTADSPCTSFLEGFGEDMVPF